MTVNWYLVGNGAGFGLLASTFLIAGFSLWDRNGRRRLALVWWTLAAVYYLVAASTLIVAVTGETPLSGILATTQWARTALIAAAVYFTVVVRHRETRQTTIGLLELVDEYGNGTSAKTYVEKAQAAG